jgi:hypothetical protein
MSRTAMIALLDTIALRKLFSLLNAQEPHIALKNQNTLKHVREDTIAMMIIISNRHYVR